MDITLASILALFAALATVPGLVLFVGWTVLTAFVTWSWSDRKRRNDPEWYARRNAQREDVEASAREVWARIVAGFDRAKG